MTQKEQVLQSKIYNQLGKDVLLLTIRRILINIEDNGFICNAMSEYFHSKYIKHDYNDIQEFIEIFRPASANPKETSSAFWAPSAMYLSKRKRVLKRIIKVLEQC